MATAAAALGVAAVVVIVQVLVSLAKHYYNFKVLSIPKPTALLVQDEESKSEQQNEYDGKHNFCHMKTNLCFLCISPF
jgi:hypothetical protein